MNRALVGQPSWLPVLRASCPQNTWAAGMPPEPAGWEACPTSLPRFKAPTHVKILEVFPPHEPFVRSSRRKEAQASWAQGDQSLLTSAATVQGLNAGRFAWGNSLPPWGGERAG